MAEDTRQMKDDHPAPSVRHPLGPEDKSGAHFQHFMPSQTSKEALYQQRQKCELKRLLKHTHPELRTLAGAVDDELAEVLNSESGVSAAETGYEGEVLSRRLIFENCALTNKVSAYSPVIHAAEETMVGGSDVSKTSAAKEMVEPEQTISWTSESNCIATEEEIKVDVQATRRIFESQSGRISRPCSGRKLQNKEASQEQKPESEMCHRQNPLSRNQSTNLIVEQQGPHVHAVRQRKENGSGGTKEASAVFEDHSSSHLGGFGQIIQTSAALSQNNPFIANNIEKEHAHAHAIKTHNPAGESDTAEVPTAKVKNRAHMFESMPFDRIRHQNKDEIETMVEKIKESLNAIHRFNAIHSNGSIIEVNETMMAKKAEFKLSRNGPEVNYDEVAEGSSQNLIHHVLPRANLKSHVTYLKEDREGNMEATEVKVPVHQHQFATSQETEFKTANVVQLIEDILHQDNSVRKGVIIQEEPNKCADITVYSLYKYADEEDVRRFCPQQGDCAGNETKFIWNSISGSLVTFPLETSESQTFPASIKPEITEKGNVKLFKSCIENGDLHYLKTLQAEPTVQEVNNPPGLTGEPGGRLCLEQTADLAEEGASEWVPVDVKRLKSMFSGDQVQTQPKPNGKKSHTHSIAPLIKNQLPLEGDIGVPPQGLKKDNVREYGAQAQEKSSDSTVVFHLDTDNEDMVLQAELVEVVDDNDEMLNLQNAIHNLQQATVEARSFHHPQQDTFLDEEPSAGSIITQQPKPQNAYKNTHPQDIHSEDTNATEACDKKDQNGPETIQKPFEDSNVSGTRAAQQEDEEVVSVGKLKAALDSLERSNINVTRGDFKAAMIYRNASKPPKEIPQNVTAESVPIIVENKACTVTQCASSQLQLREDGAVEEGVGRNKESTSQTMNEQAASEKSKRPVGPKPAIPPKPEHLSAKQNKNQSGISHMKMNTTRPEIIKQSKEVPQKDELKQDQSITDPGQDIEAHERPRQNPTISEVSQESHTNQQVQMSVICIESDNTNENGQKERPKNVPAHDGINETEETHLDFNEACKIFGGKMKGPRVKNAPVKPKRVRIAQPVSESTLRDEHTPAHVNAEEQHQSVENPRGQTDDGKDTHEKVIKLESKVELREKKGRSETEDERRQRLSVHMDEIMRGNITAAMEIFDNLRKQEELRSILCRVEEIEQDTSEVDVTSLRKVFEDVPDWVVKERTHKRLKSEHKEQKLPVLRDNRESKSPMAHVFGDLERASEEIINLKEQTLARLLDIEEAIKKALYSVSTLKSDTDIAGLSSLFKESMGTVQASPPSGTISKISIESSRTKPLKKEEGPSTNRLRPDSQSTSHEWTSAKQRASPPSSPAFISIQSAARKTDKPERLPPESTTCPTCQHSPKTEEKFRTTKTLQCNSPAPNRKRDPRKGGQQKPACCPINPRRELSVLEVQTINEESILGTKTVTENYERTDAGGNRFYSSSKTVVTAQPETTSTTGRVVISPPMYEVTTYPEVRLPISQKP